MVDKEFRVDEICQLNQIELIRPLFLKQNKQLSAEEAIINAKIASARVHIERSNQRLKIFKILSGKLNWTLVPLIEDTFVIISAITNLSSPIIIPKNLSPGKKLCPGKTIHNYVKLFCKTQSR